MTSFGCWRHDLLILLSYLLLNWAKEVPEAHVIECPIPPCDEQGETLPLVGRCSSLKRSTVYSLWIRHQPLMPYSLSAAHTCHTPVPVCHAFQLAL